MKDNISFSQTLQASENPLLQLLGANIWWLKELLAAFLILCVGWVLIKVVMRFAAKLMAKSTLDSIVVGYFSTCLRTLLYILLLIVVLGTMGVSVVSLVAVLSAAFAAVALALKDSLSNLASGLLIIANKPFEQGDYIENASLSGVVDEIHLFNCRLHTLDNKYIMVPNNTLLSGAIVNYSTAEKRRVDVTVQVGYDTDLAQAKAVLLGIVADRPEVLAEPAPFVAVSGHGDAAIEMIFRVWCKTEDYWTVYYYIMEEVINRFREAGISIPYPQLDVHMTKEG
jgi:small conductance mechanosensitive channel